MLCVGVGVARVVFVSLASGVKSEAGGCCGAWLSGARSVAIQCVEFMGRLFSSARLSLSLSLSLSRIQSSNQANNRKRQKT